MGAQCWLSEQTGIADARLRQHSKRFIHADAVDTPELSKIDSEGVEPMQSAPAVVCLFRRPIRRIEGESVEKSFSL
jgi:hypothetical protein